MSAQTTLTLANGRGIDLLSPQASDIDFAVVAEHLAKEKRYNGATPNSEYSVAEHCVRGADAILAATGDVTLAAYFLLHDAHEHLVKDLTTPLKRAVAEVAHEHCAVTPSDIVDAFDILERRADLAIHRAAGLLWPIPAGLRISIKHWDLVMFVTEWRDLMKGVEHPNWAPYAHVEPLRERILLPWPWDVARKRYMGSCARLLPVLPPSPIHHPCCERGRV